MRTQEASLAEPAGCHGHGRKAGQLQFIEHVVAFAQGRRQDDASCPAGHQLAHCARSAVLDVSHFSSMYLHRSATGLVERTDQELGEIGRTRVGIDQTTDARGLSTRQANGPPDWASNSAP